MKWIDTPAGLERAAEAMKASERVAIDTEADSLHSYFDKTCLIQVTAGGEDWIIDPLRRMALDPLRQLLEDPAKQKVLHGADYDLRILQRDFGIRIRNIFDTMIAAQLLGYESFGLAALLQRFFGVEVDKKHQRADWAQRPLPPELLAYAASDTHYLAELASKLEAELREKDRWSWAEEEFTRLEEIEWREPEPVEEGFRRMKKIAKLAPRALGVLSRLWDWRDAQARAADKPAFRILQNETMIEIAERMPSSAEELASIRGFSPWHQRKCSREVLRIVEEVRGLPESELPSRVQPKQWLRDAALERRIDKLRAVRDRIAGDLGLDPGILAPRHVLASVAQLAPLSVEQLEEIPALRRWQRGLLGEAMVASLIERQPD